MEKERMKDAAEGNYIAQILEGKVARKVVKQTVMTTVYGVTRFGARLQIAKQLKGRDVHSQLSSTGLTLCDSFIRKCRHPGGTRCGSQSLPGG